MTQSHDHGRYETPPAAGEVETLLGFLDFERATLEWKTRGLDADGLQATVGVSSMTLGGILKHLSWVEMLWFAWWLNAGDPGAPWNAIDWDADPDWDWRTAAADSPDELRAMWQESVVRARGHVADALADGGLDRMSMRRDDPVSLRWILVHMIQEYARHNGHADLIREAVDGETGE